MKTNYGKLGNVAEGNGAWKGGCMYKLKPQALGADKVSSPEQLNDYIRVSPLSVWIILAVIIVFLVGVCIWGIFSRLDTVIKAAGECNNGVFTCYVKETDISDVQIGMEITVGEELGMVTDIETVPIEVTGDMDSYLLYLGGFSKGEWVYAIRAQVPAEDGIYEAQITVESVAPMSFVWN